MIAPQGYLPVDHATGPKPNAHAPRFLGYSRGDGGTNHRHRETPVTRKTQPKRCGYPAADHANGQKPYARKT